ncbi:hypothetical protein QBC35DRAFT_470945 [Podospora australis]|uniref:Uncharacterized protein n=1 Tax=Podospora australis TaxID=1536484 RepID=A0AAN7AL49_9PEZI|nr:hypothetical protein QBC35DRAFT_470945 [Podospora australis]
MQVNGNNKNLAAQIANLTNRTRTQPASTAGPSADPLANALNELRIDPDQLPTLISPELDFARRQAALTRQLELADLLSARAAAKSNAALKAAITQNANQSSGLDYHLVTLRPNDIVVWHDDKPIIMSPAKPTTRVTRSTRAAAPSPPALPNLMVGHSIIPVAAPSSADGQGKEKEKETAETIVVGSQPSARTQQQHPLRATAAQQAQALLEATTSLPPILTREELDDHWAMYMPPVERTRHIPKRACRPQAEQEAKRQRKPQGPLRYYQPFRQIDPNEMKTTNSTIMQALEIARESEEGGRETTVIKILAECMKNIWTKIVAQPNTYILTVDEFAVFNYHQCQYQDNTIYRAAIKRFWDNTYANGRTYE